MRLVTDVELFVNVDTIQLNVRYAELHGEAKALFDKWDADGCISCSSAMFSAVVETPAPDPSVRVRTLAEEYFGKIIRQMATKDYDSYSSEDRAVLLGVASRMAQAVKKSELKD